jgi:hypothetical protein
MVKAMRGMWICPGFFLFSALLQYLGWSILPSSMFGSRYVPQTNGYFVDAGMSCALTFLIIEGTLYPLTRLCELYIWYPLGQLAFVMYLMSIMLGYIIGMSQLDLEAEERVQWLDGTNGWGTYTALYMVMLLFSFLGGLLLAIFVERPCIDLSMHVKIL